MFKELEVKSKLILQDDGYSLLSETQYDHIFLSIQIDMVLYYLHYYYDVVLETCFDELTYRTVHLRRQQTLLKIIATAATVHINFD